MERLLVECAIRAALLAGATAGVLWAARIKAAVTLHAAWTGVMLSMLLLPLSTTWGPRASMRVLPAIAATRVIVAAPTVATPDVKSPRVDPRQSDRSDRATTAPTPHLGWPRVVLGIYFLVASALLARLAIGTVRTHQLIRAAVLQDGRLTSRSCTSPVTVGWLRPVAILPAWWRQWPAAQLDAVLTHEHAHVRRRDPLVKWLALLNRALFWFHPLAWWLERRLATLSEAACDDAVLARGHDARDYSAYLLEIARDVTQAASRANVVGMAMPGPRLPERIRQMLNGAPVPKVSRTRMACTMAVCAVSCAVCATAALEQTSPQRAGDMSRLVVRPRQPRWLPLDVQPTSLPWIDGDEWAFEMQSIITREELTAYSRLQNVEQRNAFIARFWADRDPSPGTPENEFREEYTRRIQYAREHFADPESAATLAFHTDRGLIYTMFGSPDEVDRRPTGTDAYEIWHYGSVAGMGPEFTIRFLLSRAISCSGSYRVTSPPPISTFTGANTHTLAGPGRRLSVQVYPHGLATISIPVDFTRVVGVRWELRNRDGSQVEPGQLGSVANGGWNRPLTEAAPFFDTTGIGCTQALRADSYTLSTTMRSTTGQVERETLAFDVR
jgi:GWxTD domain-containing protein